MEISTTRSSPFNTKNDCRFRTRRGQKRDLRRKIVERPSVRFGILEPQLQKSIKTYWALLWNSLCLLVTREQEWKLDSKQRQFKDGGAELPTKLWSCWFGGVVLLPDELGFYVW